MKKILIVLLISMSVFSCLTTGNILGALTDAASEKAAVAVVEEVSKDVDDSTETTGVHKDSETAEISSVHKDSEPAKVVPTEQLIVDAVKAYDLDGLTQLLADVEDVKTIVGDDVLLCHLAEEAMGMTAEKNEVLALLVEKKAYILQVDKDGKSMTRYAHAMEMGGTDRTNYMDEVIGDKFQKRIEALRSDDLDTIISMTQYFPVDAYLLRSAVKEKAIKVAFWVMEQGVPIDGINPKTGDNLLHLACNDSPIGNLFESRADLVNTLIAEGVDINLKNKKGNTPIAQLFIDRGAKNGSPDLLVKILLDAGADVNTVSSQKITLLNHATRRRSDELVSLLLDEGAVIDDGSLNDMNLSIAVMTMFLDKGANPDAFADNLRSFSSDPDAQLEFSKDLIARGASMSAFILQDLRNNFEVVKYLVEQGADINGGTILMSCLAEYKGMERIEYLINHGADVNKKFYQDKTALQFAVRTREIEPVIYLIEHGAELNAVDEKGKTPLDYCKAKNEDMMNALIEAGAKSASEL